MRGALARPCSTIWALFGREPLAMTSGRFVVINDPCASQSGVLGAKMILVLQCPVLEIKKWPS